MKITNFKLQIRRRLLSLRGFGGSAGVTGGFTLIELLIVIAIIGILAAVLITVLNPVKQQQKARDSNRRQALSKISEAMTACYLSEGSWAGCDTIAELKAGTTPYLMSNVSATVLNGDDTPTWNCSKASATGCVSVSAVSRSGYYYVFDYDTTGRVVEQNSTPCTGSCGTW